MDFSRNMRVHTMHRCTLSELEECCRMHASSCELVLGSAPSRRVHTSLHKKQSRAKCGARARRHTRVRGVRRQVQGDTGLDRRKTSRQNPRVNDCVPTCTCTKTWIHLREGEIPVTDARRRILVRDVPTTGPAYLMSMKLAEAFHNGHATARKCPRFTLLLNYLCSRLIPYVS